MIDLTALQLLLMGLTGWLARREREAIAYLVEENRFLRQRLGGRRLYSAEIESRRYSLGCAEMAGIQELRCSM